MVAAVYFCTLTYMALDQQINLRATWAIGRKLRENVHSHADVHRRRRYHQDPFRLREAVLLAVAAARDVPACRRRATNYVYTYTKLGCVAAGSDLRTREIETKPKRRGEPR